MRNNPDAVAGVNSMTSNLVGRGISPRWRTGNKSLDRKIKALWDQSIKEIDYDGNLDFYGLQAMVADTVQISGEVLVSFNYLRRRRGLAVPFQIRVLEADHLYDTFNTTLPNGNSLRLGVEFTRGGRRVAYHIYKEHPGEMLVITEKSIDTIRVPESEMLHVYAPRRPGQIRGVPWLANIITRLRQLDEYEDAELMRKKMAAMFGAFVETPSGEDEDSLIPGQNVTATTSDGDTETYSGFEPGMIQYLEPGEKITLAEPADVGGNYDVWIKRQLHSIAKGMGITYEQLTGDLSSVNYSSIRAGLLEFRRRCKMLQNNLMIYKFCRPVAQRWLDIAVLSGAIDIPDYLENYKKYNNTIWYPDGWEWVDPEKDMKGQKMAVRSGFKSRAQVAAENDRDIDELDEEIASDNKRADKLDLTFDSDPRKVSSTGAKHKEDDDGGGFDE